MIALTGFIVGFVCGVAFTVMFVIFWMEGKR